MKLAERLGAQVVTDLKVAAAFPTDHPLACRRAEHDRTGGGAASRRSATPT